MKTRTCRLTTMASMILAGASSLAAATPTAANLAEERVLSTAARNFLLDGPHIYKVNARTKDLVVEDLNGDGLLDIAAVSNEKSLLHLFIQQKNAADESERFKETPVTLDRIVRNMVAMDVDGDGRMDLVLAASPAPMAIMYQDRDGRLQPPRNTSMRADRLVVGDLNGDNRPDLLVYNEQKFDILLGNARGLNLDSAESFHTTGTPASAPMIIDFDGDGRTDIVYHDSTRFNNLVVRLQSVEKTFPVEFRSETAVLRSVAAMPAPRGQRASVAAIHNVTRSLIQLGLQPVEAQTEKERPVPFSQLQTIAFPPDQRSAQTRSTIADVDGDGRLDVVLFSPQLSTLRVLRQTRSGSLTAQTSPSLSGIQAVLPIAGDRGKPTRLLVFSPTERAIGVAEHDKETGQIPFPALLPVAGEPVGVALAPVRGKQSVVVALKETGGARLVGYELLGGNKLGEEKALIADGERNPLAGIDIVALQALDLNRDGRTDIIAFADFKPAVALLQEENGTFTMLQATSGVLQGLLSGARFGAIEPVTLERRKDTTALATRDSFVRSFSIDADRNVVIDQQFNGRDASSRLVSAAAGFVRGERQAELLLLDRGNRVLTVYGTRDGGSYEILQNEELGDVTYLSVRAVDLDGDQRDDVLLTADDRLSVLYSRQLVGPLQTIATASTPVKDGAFGKVYTANLLKEPTPQAVAVEMRENLLEFFTAGTDAEKKPALHRFYSFITFDQGAGLGRRVNLDALPEPRDLLAADLNEDGRTDVITITHDNIIVYMGAEKEGDSRAAKSRTRD